MPGIDDLPTFSDQPDIVYTVIETPRGSRAKFKYEPALGVFNLHKSLGLGFCYPFAFGFIPGTRAEDGDPLDVLMFTTLDLPMGSIVKARPICAMEIEQREDGHGPVVRNDRLIAVPAIEHDDRQRRGIEPLAHSEIEDIGAFFIASAERDGKEVKIVGLVDGGSATALVRKAQI